MSHRLRDGPYMSSTVRILVAAALAAASAHSQTASKTFDVASIHPAPPLDLSRAVKEGRTPVGVTIGAGRVEISSMTLGELIPWAFRTKSYQIVAPQWDSLDRWDIMASFSGGVSKSQVPDMLQCLLKERFGLEVHQEIRKQNVFILGVGKNGAKLQAASAESIDTTPGPAAGVSNTFHGRIDQSNGPSMSISGTPVGIVRVSMGTEENQQSSRVEMHANMTQLADLLALDRPIIDQTDLKGIFDVVLMLPNREVKRLMRTMIGLGMTGGDMPDVPAVAKALKELGLALKVRSAPIEVLVVDHLERRPTDN